MTDRLNDLKKGNNVTVGGISTDNIHIEGGGGGGDSLIPKNDSFMQDFFQNVEIVKNNIILIKNATKRVSEINQDVILATTSEKESELSAELTPLIAETNKKAAFSKQMLQRLEEETNSIEEGNVKSSELRIRKNLVSTLTRKFVDVMKEYQNAQQKYKTDIRKKVKRQVHIVKPDATTDEIDAVLKSGSGSGGVLRSAILNGDAADPIRNAYMNVADKYQDVLALEASVAELHQMFLDFAVLTEQQGELLDQIEFQVKSATDYIDEANANMNQAIEYQKQIRGRQCCLFMILIIIIGIIIGIVFGLKSSGQSLNRN